jgi:hypothetical protein
MCVCPRALQVAMAEAALGRAPRTIEERWEEVDEIAKDRRDVRKVCAVHACAVPRGMGLRV